MADIGFGDLKKLVKAVRREGRRPATEESDPLEIRAIASREKVKTEREKKFEQIRKFTTGRESAPPGRRKGMENTLEKFLTRRRIDISPTAYAKFKLRAGNVGVKFKFQI